ncbi:hypothetical protein VVT58_07090 [Sphingobium sp. SJ10-10]|uniref:hypothetical protein n=1 Tax=Sphingobium sp. SJ10-10 TaxID=3114999 RepID=UPI002E174D94|nr:hypothetical protein [Sphingobium sp. SJ10-10]
MAAQMVLLLLRGKPDGDATWWRLARPKEKIPGFTKIPNGKLTSALHPLFTKE